MPLDIYIDSLKWEVNSGLIIWDYLLITLTGISLALLFSRPLISSDISYDEHSER